VHSPTPPGSRAKWAQLPSPAEQAGLGSGLGGAELRARFADAAEAFAGKQELVPA